MGTFSKGLDLLESDFDIINTRVSLAVGENYSTKTCKTDKGYWMQIEESYKEYFTIEEINSSVIYTPKNKFTAPSLLPYAVEIPAIYQWAFPEDKFVLSGFIIPLDTYQSTKIVNLSYFQWAEFRAELDSGNYEALKRSLMPLWDYVAEQVTNGNIIVL
jgi:hypothetical protein